MPEKKHHFKPEAHKSAFCQCGKYLTHSVHIKASAEDKADYLKLINYKPEVWWQQQ